MDWGGGGGGDGEGGGGRRGAAGIAATHLSRPPGVQAVHKHFRPKVGKGIISFRHRTICATIYVWSFHKRHKRVTRYVTLPSSASGEEKKGLDKKNDYTSYDHPAPLRDFGG